MKMQLLEQPDYECYNCETSYQIISNEEDLAVSFCPFCGAEIGDEDSFDEDDIDEDDQ